MGEWKHIYFFESLIVARSATGYKIRMPNGSGYNGFYLWASSKLARPLSGGDVFELIYKDGFVFELKKYGKGIYNKRDVVQTVRIDAETLKIALGQPNLVSRCDLHIPRKLTPQKAIVPEELKDE